MNDGSDHALDHVTGFGGSGGHRRYLDRWNGHAHARREDVAVSFAALEFINDHEATWVAQIGHCLLYTSDAADERSSVDLGGRRIIKKKNIRSTTGMRVI